MGDMSESVQGAPADDRGRSDQDWKTGWDPLPVSLHNREILCPEGPHVWGRFTDVTESSQPPEARSRPLLLLGNREAGGAIRKTPERSRLFLIWKTRIPR